jgi:hypothetical protein
MSEETNKPSPDEQLPQLVDVLIKTAIDYSATKPMTLAEMYGQFGIAQRVLFDRAAAAASQSQNPPSGPVGDVGTEGEAGASPAEGEDKA